MEEVTDEPVTHVVYSHWHADHIGAASLYGKKVKIIAHDKTKDLLQRFPDPYRPVPTDTFSKDTTLDVHGVKLELSYKGQNHSEGNIFIYAPKQKVLAAIDIASPGWVTFRDCDSSENFCGYVDAHHQILDYDFKTLVSGHVSKLGTKEDVKEGLEYLEDLERQALGRAAERRRGHELAQRLFDGREDAARTHPQRLHDARRQAVLTEDFFLKAPQVEPHGSAGSPSWRNAQPRSSPQHLPGNAPGTGATAS